MTSRNAYIALTPDVTDFAANNSADGVTFIPAPGTKWSSSPRFGDLQELRERYQAFYSRCHDFIEVNAGMLCIISSQLFFSSMNLAVKELNALDPPVPPLELIVVRMAITFTCCILYMVIMKIPDPFLGPKGVRMLLVSRGLTGFFGLFGMYYCLQYLSLAEATVLTFLGPLTTAVAGFLILKEDFTRREAMAGVFSLIGVILIARPAFIFGSMSAEAANPDSMDSAVRATPIQRLTAVGASLMGVLGGTGATISIRAIGTRAHPLHSMTFFSLWCCIVASVGLVVLEVPIVYPTRWEWIALLFMIGFFGFFAQTLITMGLQRETAARGSMGVYAQILFAGALEQIFFHTIPSSLSIVGTVIIIASAVWVVIARRRESSKSSVALTTSEDASLEEGLLQGRDSASQEEILKLESVSMRTASPLGTREGNGNGFRSAWTNSGIVEDKAASS